VPRRAPYLAVNALADRRADDADEVLTDPPNLLGCLEVVKEEFITDVAAVEEDEVVLADDMCCLEDSVVLGKVVFEDLWRP
jgi:hypothetical protein